MTDQAQSRAAGRNEPDDYSPGGPGLRAWSSAQFGPNPALDVIAYAAQIEVLLGAHIIDSYGQWAIEALEP
jgi:hypothetical protein